MKFGRSTTPGAILIVLGVLLAAAGCKSSSQWQLLREGKSGKITTKVLVRTEPSDAEIRVNGEYVGRSPVEIPFRYLYATKVYERKVYLPYPHFEERDLVGYDRNEFTIEARITGYELSETKIALKGEEKKETTLVLEKDGD